MSRREEYLESILADLGSVYYQTLQGKASEADVARAVETVRSHEGTMRQSTLYQDTVHRGTAGPGGAGGDLASIVPGPRHGRWRVVDVMATDVITADKNMPYKQLASLLAEHDLSAIPVISGGGRVLGMVSEADVLRKEERSFSRMGAGLRPRTHRQRAQAEALSAAKLMTSPAITIHPDAPLGAAARLMNGHHIRMLPVVNPAGELIGIVSRRDLLSVYLRPDAQIAAEISGELTGMLADAAHVEVSVTGGEVTLAGDLPESDLIGAVIRIVHDVDGVVAVTSRLTAGQAQHSS